MNCDRNDYLTYLNEISQKNILNYQLKCLNDYESIYVINTILFWGIDYFGKDKYDEYISINLN